VDGDVDRLAAGQRPDLTVFRIAVLALLAVDGVLSAIGGALFLPSYVGAVPFPISTLVSGVLNAALVWVAGHWTTSVRVAVLPLWTWLLAVLFMCQTGPGGDVIFAGRGIMAYGLFLLLAAGLAPSVWVLWRRRPAL
jgi:hypothetical protein